MSVLVASAFVQLKMAATKIALARAQTADEHPTKQAGGGPRMALKAGSDGTVGEAHERTVAADSRRQSLRNCDRGARAKTLQSAILTLDDPVPRGLQRRSFAAVDA